MQAFVRVFDDVFPAPFSTVAPRFAQAVFKVLMNFRDCFTNRQSVRFHASQVRINSAFAVFFDRGSYLHGIVAIGVGIVTDRSKSEQILDWLQV